MAVTLSHGELFDAKITLTPVLFSLIGLALAIFLGFRNSAAYDRYWEARKLWGELIFRSRSLARQLLTLTRMETPSALPRIGAPGAIDVRHAIIRRTIAFAHVLRQQLRGIEAPDELRPWLTDAELAAVATSRSANDLLLRLSSREPGDCLRAGQIEPQIAAQVDRQFTGLAEMAAGCERIASTPIPFAYTLLLHRTA